MNDEPMQVVSFVGGPADGVVALVPSHQSSLPIEQPGTRDQGPIVGPYVATSAFGPQGYPAWEWLMASVDEAD